MGEGGSGGFFMRRIFLVAMALALLVPWSTADDTKAAAGTREKLKQKVTLDFKDTRLDDVKDTLKEMTGISFRLDTPGGVSRNQQITYMGKDVPLEEALDVMFKKSDLGYVVISKEKNAYDGTVLIKKGAKYRGYDDGEGPDKAMKKEDKTDKGKTKTKETTKKETTPKKEASKDESKDEKKDEAKKEDKPKPEDDEERIETMATRRLKTVKELIDDGKKEKARDVLEDIIKRYPKTKAAVEAKKVLKELDD
jgi:hypothetical protein